MRKSVGKLSVSDRMDEVLGQVLFEGADHLTNIGRIEIADQKAMLKVADGSYRVFLEELIAFANSQPKSLSKPGEQMVKDWVDTENAEDAIDEITDLDRRSMGSVCEEEEDYDPDLEMFLENLKPFGFAYVLDIPRSRRIEYEDEDEDEFKLTDESRRKVSKSNPSDSILQLLQKKSDLEKKLQILDNVISANTKRAQKKSTCYSSTYNKRKASYKEKNEALTSRRSSRKCVRKSLVEDSSSDYSDDLQDEPIQHQSHVLPNNLRKRQEPLKDDPPVKHSKGKREKERVQTSLYENSGNTYIYFLRDLNMVGDSLLYADDKGNRHTYEDSSDSDFAVLETPSKKRLQSSESDSLTLEPSKKRCLSSGKKGPMNLKTVVDPSYDFRKMLMELLLKPYDEEECHNLLKEAKVRKPVMHHRDMRGENCSYPAELGKSYLDRYHDLNTAIKSVQPDEPHKVLHLLRGLFFYLTHTCMEDQFIPWHDDSWMKAVSESKHH